MIDNAGARILGDMGDSTQSAAATMAKAREAARIQKPFTVKSFTLPPETEAQLEQILSIFLEELNQTQLRDSLAYCLRELTVNGKKANTKRVYFEEKGLNLDSENDYRTGMATFKSETLDNIKYWLGKQEEKGLYVRVTFHVKGRDLHLTIGNNTLITRKEQIRVYDRIARSRAFSSLEEAMTSVLDDSEGAGLGIVILVLMLKRIGLSEDAFDIDVEDNETVARLIIPMDETKSEQLSHISRRLADQIDRLPEFPESILELRRMLDDPDAEMAEIARSLGKDPSLTADLLRTVNSARYALANRMDNVVEAVKIVGLRGLKQMLLSYGTRRVLGEDNDVSRRLWDHSQRTAFFAYGLARAISRRKEILDDVYVGGILHDMGKIVFSNMHPEVVERMTEFCRQKGIPTTLFEAVSDGIDHAEVGARLAERWNFPEALVESIRFHHNPMRSSTANREVVSLVYLANELVKVENELYDAIDARVLRGLGINNKEQLSKIRERLEEQYRRQFRD